VSCGIPCTYSLLFCNFSFCTLDKHVGAAVTIPGRKPEKNFEVLALKYKGRQLVNRRLVVSLGKKQCIYGS